MGAAAAPGPGGLSAASPRLPVRPGKPRPPGLVSPLSSLMNPGAAGPWEGKAWPERRRCCRAGGDGDGALCAAGGDGPGRASHRTGRNKQRNFTASLLIWERQRGQAAARLLAGYKGKGK